MVGRRVISISGCKLQKQPELVPARRKLLSTSYHIMTTTKVIMMMIVVMIMVVLLQTTKVNSFHVIPSILRPLQKSYGATTTTSIGIYSQIQHDDHHSDDSHHHLHTNCDCQHGMNHDASSSSSSIITKQQQPKTNFKNVLHRLWNRFNILYTMKVQSEMNIQDIDSNKAIILTAGIGSGLFGTIKKLHDPIVYFVLGILAGFRYDWCFRSPVYWFAIGFTIKWYRARYVFKIPVWDRQPNWNNIITSKEQEKDLKAFTCKNCGSTIFIAKTREFFFEGNTGIGGLGCFSCGARGKDNFIMDRDRIVEDVGDMDDYFEYERPLDFVSRAERRKLLKEAQGDEDKANQLLLERTTGMSSTSTTTTITSTSTDTPLETIDAVIVDDEDDATMSTTLDETTIPTDLVEVPQLLDDETATTVAKVDDVSFDEESLLNGETTTVESHDPEHVNDKDLQISTSIESTAPAVTTPSQPKSKSSQGLDGSKPKSKSTQGLEGLDELDMDAW